MTSDEDQGVHEHVVEIANDLPAPRGARRRSFATMAVAVCLGLVGAVTAFALVRDQSEKASADQRDATQREQLLDGWNTLGAVAAAQHTSDAASVPPVPSTRDRGAVPQPGAAAPVQNVIVVGSPAPAPQTNQSLPAPTSSNASTGANAATTSASASAPMTLSSPPSAMPPPAPGLSTRAGVPAPPSAPNQTPLTPAPGSPDTVLSPITYPASQSCGLTTCNVDSVCCNVSCGVCTAPGEGCSQTQCG